MNDTPHFLLTRFGFKDFIIRGNRKILDKIATYKQTMQEAKNLRSEDFKKSLANQGYTPEVFKLYGVFENLSNLSDKEVCDFELPFELDKTTQQIKTKRQEILNIKKSLPKEKDDELAKELAEIEINLASLIRKETENRGNIEMAKGMLSVNNDSKKELEIKEFDESEKLLKLENEIIELFVSSKFSSIVERRFNEGEVQKIVNGEDEKSFSNKDFKELIDQIWGEPENATQEKYLNFFENTPNLQNKEKGIEQKENQ